MKFVIVNHYATSPYHVGGTRHYDLAKELIQKGHEVIIIASSFSHLTKTDHKEYGQRYYIKENINGVTFIWIKTEKYNNSLQRIKNILSFYFNVNKIIKSTKIIEQTDIVIGSTVHFLAAQNALKIKKKTGAMFIFEERDFWPQTFIDFGKISKYNIISILLFKYEKYFYKNADKIITLFPNATKYFLEKGVEEKDIIFLPNGFSELTNITSHNNSKLKSVLNANSVTYIGSHGIANELDIVLDLAKIATKFDFILIGDGPEKKRLINRKIDEGITNIHFFDPVNKSEVQSILRDSKFSIISIKDSPLYKYGFSMNKINDYLLAGKPIVMLASSKLANEYVTKGISVSLDIHEQSNKLNEYLLNSKLYKEEMNNIKKFRKKYNWKYLSEKFIESILNDNDSSQR